MKSACGRLGYPLGQAPPAPSTRCRPSTLRPWPRRLQTGVSEAAGGTAWPSGWAKTCWPGLGCVRSGHAGPSRPGTSPSGSWRGWGSRLPRLPAGRPDSAQSGSGHDAAAGLLLLGPPTPNDEAAWACGLACGRPGEQRPAVAAARLNLRRAHCIPLRTPHSSGSSAR